MVEVTSKTPKGGWKDGRRTGRGRYVNGEEIAEINRKFRDLEDAVKAVTADRDSLRQAVETCDQKMSRLGDANDEWVLMYQVMAGWWHKVLAAARRECA